MLQNYPIYQVYCTFDRTSEFVSVMNVKYPGPFSYILSEIALLTDSAVDEYRSKLLRIEESLVHDADPLDIADQIKATTMSMNSPLLRGLLYILPAFYLYTSSTYILKAVDLSPHETDYYKSSILDDNGSVNVEMAEAKLSLWNERTSIIRQILSKREPYYQLIQLLTGKINFAKPDMDAYCEMYHIREAEQDYVTHAWNTFTELKRIHDDFSSENTDIERIASAYRQLSSVCTIVDSLSPQCPLSTRSASQVVYAVSSLTDLVALELLNMQQNGKQLLRCPFCGRLFASYSSSSKYCPFPNPDYEGKTCREVAPAIEFANRKRSAPFGVEYQKNYTTYFRWAARNQNDKSMKALHSFLFDSCTGTKKECARYADQQISNIQAEIKCLFDQWVDRAKQAQDLYTEGKISEQDCAAAIQTPSVQSRSPLLASLHAEMKEYN